MSVFNPEQREFSESGFEGKKFGKDTEAKLRAAMDGALEGVPDLVACPNKACGNPLTVRVRADEVLLNCDNCGWKFTLTRDNQLAK